MYSYYSYRTVNNLVLFLIYTFLEFEENECVYIYFCLHIFSVYEDKNGKET